MSYFVVGGPKFTGLFPPNAVNHVFSILDIIHSGDIRDRVLKLSEIAPNFARLSPRFCRGQVPRILGP